MFPFSSKELRKDYNEVDEEVFVNDDFTRALRTFMKTAPFFTLVRLRELADDTRIVQFSRTWTPEFCAILEKDLRSNALVTAYSRNSGHELQNIARVHGAGATVLVYEGKDNLEENVGMYIGNRYEVWFCILRTFMAAPPRAYIPPIGDKIYIRMVGVHDDKSIIEMAQSMKRLPTRYVITSRKMSSPYAEEAIKSMKVQVRTGDADRPYNVIPLDQTTAREAIFAFFCMYCEFAGLMGTQVKRLFDTVFLNQKPAHMPEWLHVAYYDLAVFSNVLITLEGERSPKMDVMVKMWNNAQRVKIGKEPSDHLETYIKASCRRVDAGLLISCSRLSYIQSMIKNLKKRVQICADLQYEMMFNVESEIESGEHLLRYSEGIPDPTVVLLLGSHSLHKDESKNDYSMVLAGVMSQTYDHYIVNPEEYTPNPADVPSKHVMMGLAACSIAIKMCLPRTRDAQPRGRCSVHCVTRLLPLFKILPWTIVAFARDLYPESWESIRNTHSYERVAAVAFDVMDKWSTGFNQRPWLMGLFAAALELPSMNGFYFMRSHFPLLHRRSLGRCLAAIESLNTHRRDMSEYDVECLKMLADEVEIQHSFNTKNYDAAELDALAARGIVRPERSDFMFENAKTLHGFLLMLDLIREDEAGILLSEVIWGRTRANTDSPVKYGVYNDCDMYRPGVRHGFIARICTEMTALATGELRVLNCRDRGGMTDVQQSMVYHKSSFSKLNRSLYVCSTHRYGIQHHQMWTSSTADACWAKHSPLVTHTALSRISKLE